MDEENEEDVIPATLPVDGFWNMAAAEAGNEEKKEDFEDMD